MQLGLRVDVAGTQGRELLGVSEEKLDLEMRLVPTIKRLCIQVGIATEQDRFPLGVGIDQPYHAQVAPKMHVVEDLRVERDGVVFARTRSKRDGSSPSTLPS